MRAAIWLGTGNPHQALRHWGTVRELADTLPGSAETVALGLRARIFALQYGRRLGISQEQAEAVFSEAERIASKAGDVRSRTLLLLSYGTVRLGEGDVRDYARLARQAFALAEESGDPALYLAIAPGAYAFLCTGEYREAVAICNRALELAAGDPTVGAGINFGCPYASCLAMKGLSLANLGELEEARRLIEQARKIAREQGDIETVGISHMFSTYLADSAGEPEAALAMPTRRSRSRNGSGTRYTAVPPGSSSAWRSGRARRVAAGSRGDRALCRDRDREPHGGRDRRLAPHRAR